MRRIVVIPAVFIGCLIVVWVGTVAAANMPSQELLVPTTTAAAQLTQAAEKSNETSAQQSSQKGFASEVSACVLPASYPDEIRQWCDLIEDSALKTNLPVRLIAAVILQESGGDPLICSSSGAIGLMQVMPRDGLASEFMCANGPCFASRPLIEELQDPAFNIAYGSQLLAELYTKHGSYREALFRYGPMDVGYYYADLVLQIWDTYQ